MASKARTKAHVTTTLWIWYTASWAIC